MKRPDEAIERLMAVYGHACADTTCQDIREVLAWVEYLESEGE